MERPPSVERPRVTGMPPPKRRAPSRSSAAIAEDLAIVRSAGGMARAGENELAATLDWLSVAESNDVQGHLARARDLLVHYIRRVCEAYEVSTDVADKTAKAAARSLLRLQLRPASDDRLVDVIRRGVLGELQLVITTDAVRHREDRLLREISVQIAADLEGRARGVPLTVAAAAHNLAPVAIDLRQQLHDGLCLLYPQAPPADPREQRMVSWFYAATVVELGDLLTAAHNLEDAGLRQPNLSRTEFALVNFGRHLSRRLFTEADDRTRMLAFVHENRTGTPSERSEVLQKDSELRPLYERWVAWINACYPTCAFERSTDIGYMCSPHAYLTLLYDFEVAYLAAGYSQPEIDDNEPLRHHSLAVVDAYQL